MRPTTPNRPEFHVLIEPHTGASYAEQLAVARAVEDLGLAGSFRADHYYCAPSQRTGPTTTDVWTTLAGLARETTAITLGSLVSAATFRHPVALAVTAAQIDAMSDGRLEVGIGAAWWQAEHQAFGIPFPAVDERFDRLTEQLDILTGLWSTAPEASFDMPAAITSSHEAPGVWSPRPGGPPIIIGGSGPRRTPALAARYAAEFNSGWQPPDRTRREFKRVDRACRAIGRERASLRKSTVQTLCLGRTDAEVSERTASLGLEQDSGGIIGTPTAAAARTGGVPRSRCRPDLPRIARCSRAQPARALRRGRPPSAGRYQDVA